MRVVHINTADKGGGAEGSAFNLVRALRQHDYDAQLVVGTKYSAEPWILELPRLVHPIATPLKWIADATRGLDRKGIPGMRRITRSLERLASPTRCKQWIQGKDETDFPASHQIDKLIQGKIDIFHCHNLHGWYFDLNALVTLSKVAPVILNLRDTWALTGHCAYFLDCQKWQQGCGDCPRLTIYPAVRRDATSFNLQQKANIYAQANLAVTAPSQWLLDQVNNSILKPKFTKLIPNGIDTTIFKPADKAEAREKLNLNPDEKLVLFAAAAKKSPFKDPDTLVNAVKILLESDSSIAFACVGIKPDNLPDNPRIRLVDYVSNPKTMASWYQAADIFVHTAKAEAFGKTITESMACGTPVVATRIGGIPEQVIPGQTGELSAPEDPADLAQKALALLALPDPAFQALRHNAASFATQFSLGNQLKNFTDWYHTLVQH